MTHPFTLQFATGKLGDRLREDAVFKILTPAQRRILACTRVLWEDKSCALIRHDKEVGRATKVVVAAMIDNGMLKQATKRLDLTFLPDRDLQKLVRSREKQ